MSDLLTYMGYYGSAHYSAADEVFYGKLEGIDDLVNYEGTSVKELIKAFNEAVEDYLETCKEIGKDPNKTYKGSFNVRIPTDLHRNAAIFAASKDISLNDFVKTAIQYALMNKGSLQRDLSPSYSLEIAEEAAPYKAAPKKRKKAASAGKGANTGARKGKKSSK
jgi:predicted HicB family RNase H-like nuclease